MPSIISATTTSGLVSTADNSGSLQLATNNGTTAVTIDTSQNVGIGTASPSAKLHVSGGNIQMDNNQGLLFGGGNNYIYGNETTDFVAIATNGSERMRIDSSGNVGIGTNGPSSSLTVQRTSAAASLGLRHTASGNGYGYNFSTTGTTTHDLIINSEFNGSNTERMRLSGGNLLVGTNSVPNSTTAISSFGGRYSFCINSGSFNYYQGTESNNFNVYSGDGVLRGYLGVAGTWTNTSDISYKKDIVDIKYGLQDALNLRPVSYVTKDYDIEQIGFIAQEMEQVIPEVVSGEDGSKGISYGSLVALCVKSIQELKAELDATKAEVAALKGA